MFLAYMLYVCGQERAGEERATFYCNALLPRNEESVVAAGWLLLLSQGYPGAFGGMQGLSADADLQGTHEPISVHH